MAIIHAVLEVWNTSLDVRFRTKYERRNVFSIVAKRLHRSPSALRKAFDEAWGRQCPYETKPSWERRQRVIRMHLRMQGKSLPRTWREPVFVSRGDSDSHNVEPVRAIPVFSGAQI
jgi:hypothetical protein